MELERDCRRAIAGLGDDLSVAEESPQIPSLKHVPSDEHAVEIEERWPTLKAVPPKGKSHGKQTSSLGSNSTEETRVVTSMDRLIFVTVHLRRSQTLRIPL